MLLNVIRIYFIWKYCYLLEMSTVVEKVGSMIIMLKLII